MTEKIVYNLNVNPEGKLECAATWPYDDDDIPLVISQFIRKTLGLGPDEQPVFIPDGKGNVIIKKR